ncbi:hypothetical protein [Parabacteroides sp. AM58-2XD]|uniref:hypothetical protein n=1 Tax=Parabacteroides sp. AM58-2XD TaxID=2292362 RepID=UPI000FE23332|nr:hypothetical protein [Parabacteroides sp. AM58-2XD]
MLVREYHDSQYQRKSGGVKVWIDDFIQHFYNSVVVLTPQEVGYFKYKKNIKVIPNPTKGSAYISDLSYFKYKKNIKVIPNPTKGSAYISDLSYTKIVTVGRIE